MKSFFSNWTFMRFLRLALGIYICILGIVEQQWTFIILGILFSLMPIANIGCCGGKTCCSANKEKKKISLNKEK